MSLHLLLARLSDLLRMKLTMMIRQLSPNKRLERSPQRSRTPSRIAKKKKSKPLVEMSSEELWRVRAPRLIEKSDLLSSKPSKKLVKRK